MRGWIAGLYAAQPLSRDILSVIKGRRSGTRPGLILELGLTPLVEVHDEPEIMRDLKIKDLHWVGSNNRDPTSFDVSLETAQQLRRMVFPDILAAMYEGADLIGINFHPGSPRSIDVRRFREIISVMREHWHITYVGVFVNLPVEDVRATMDACGLDLAQLQGNETHQVLDALGGEGFKAFREIPEHPDGFAGTFVEVLRQ